MMRAIDNRTLPAVSFYNPIGKDDENPGYADLTRGDRNAEMIIRTIWNSFIWDDAVIIVTLRRERGYVEPSLNPPRVRPADFIKGIMVRSSQL